jgi:hypothetical protein
MPNGANMTRQDQRLHPRCVRTIPISFAYLNRSEEHSGTALNYSRFGMYFETAKQLGVGTMLVIRPVHPKAAPPEPNPESGAVEEKIPAEYSPCDELKNLVVAQIKRCVRLSDDKGPRYGVGVHFVSPAV